MKGFLEFFDDLAHSRGHGAKWLEPEVFTILVEGALRILLAKEDVTQQGVRRCCVRHAGHSFSGMGSRFLPAAQEPVGFGEFIMALRGVGLQLEAAEQSRFGLRILLGFI